jgi:predicted DNA-binding transcriptional regulator AlpA
MSRASPNRAHTESNSLPPERRTGSFNAAHGRGIPRPTIPEVTGAKASADRTRGADSVLWMRDITALTGVHRSTITRWINRGEFPKKDAPHANPNGWLRSTYERWLLGSAQLSARDTDSAGA